MNACTSVAVKRAEFARIIGVVDARQPIDGLEFVGSTAVPSLIATSPSYEVFAIRWPVLDGVDGEGFLLRPNVPSIAHVIAIPDADWSPEMLVGLASGLGSGAQFARRLAELGCEVVVPMLIDRSDAWSGYPAIRMTNQPHREYVYRMAYEVGRHMISYEVQKVLTVVDFFASAPDNAPVAVYSYGEEDSSPTTVAPGIHALAPSASSGIFTTAVACGRSRSTATPGGSPRSSDAAVDRGREGPGEPYEVADPSVRGEAQGVLGRRGHLVPQGVDPHLRALSRAL